MGGVTTYPEGTAAAAGLSCCHVCTKLAPTSEHRCPRCGSALHVRTPASIQQCVALLVTAAVLYVPANVLPIMTTVQLGRSIDNTIVGGVIVLVKMGSYPVAAVIFIASVMVPLAKFGAMGWLCWTAVRGRETGHRERAVLYRVTEFIGRWSMVDVFVVTILVGLVSLGQLLVITPGPAALAFGGVVVATMLAAERFDSRAIWDHQESAHG